MSIKVISLKEYYKVKTIKLFTFTNTSISREHSGLPRKLHGKCLNWLCFLHLLHVLA